MAQAVARYQVDLERGSFKGSVDSLRQYRDALAQARNPKMRRQLWEDLLLNLARDLVRCRPNRQEPRAVKRRPKPHPLLNQPRRRFVAISRRSRYSKRRPRNYRNLNQGPFRPDTLFILDLVCESFLRIAGLFWVFHQGSVPVPADNREIRVTVDGQPLSHVPHTGAAPADGGP